MHPKDHQPFSRPHRKGFSLVEAAIVLGVVGLVIGGIWYAANTVQSSMRVSDLTKSVIQTAEATKKSFSAATTRFGTMVILAALGAWPSLPR